MKTTIVPRPIVILVLLLGMVLTGCSFVSIQNISDATVTVMVTVPDSGGGYTRTIRAGEIAEVFSSHGGSYTVSVIPSEGYRTTLEDLRETISRRLFQEGATLTSEDVARLVENLNHIDQLLRELEIPGASCAGRVPDFETAVAIVSFDELAGNYSLSCQ